MTTSASAIPLMSRLTPRLVDPLWHRVDVPRDEEAELSRLEREHEAKVKAIAKSYSDITPIGKTSQEPLEDDDDDDDDDDNDNDDNDDSDSHDDEDDVEMDVTFNGVAAGGGGGGGAGGGPNGAVVPNNAAVVANVVGSGAGQEAPRPT